MSSYKYHHRIILTVIITIFINCTWANSTVNRENTLILGKVSDNPNKHYNNLKPMANYLAKHLHDVGIVKGDVLLAENNHQMIRYLHEGRVDFVTETVVSSALFIQKTQAIPLLRKWKNSASSYQSLIFVRKNSSIHSLKDLLGKRIALQDFGSTTAYFIPMATFFLKNLPVVLQPSPRDKPPANTVGAYLTNDDNAISPLVYGGVVDAGALSNIDWQKSKRVPKHHRQAFKIIYQSNHWPRMIELVAAHVNPNVRQRIKEILLQAHLDPEANSVLKAYQNTSQFDELGKDDWNALSIAQEMLSFIKWSE